MTMDALQHIPLTQAYLCLDCNEIGNSAMRCPACASQVLLSLAGIFDRKEIAEPLAANVLLFPSLVSCSPQVVQNRARG